MGISNSLDAAQVVLISVDIRMLESNQTTDSSAGHIVLESRAPTSASRINKKCSICLETIGPSIDHRILLVFPNYHPAILHIIDTFLNDPCKLEHRTLPCKHVFHTTCIDQWLLPRFHERLYCFDCPMCRTVFT